MNVECEINVLTENNNHKMIPMKVVDLDWDHLEILFSSNPTKCVSLSNGKKTISYL